MGDRSRGAADDGGVGGYVADDGCAGPDDGVVADDKAGDDGGTGTDHGAVTDGDVAGDYCAGPDMDEVAKFAIVVNGCAGIDDAEFADTGVSADDRAGEDHGSVAESGGGRDDGIGMDEDREPQANGASVFGESLAGNVIADGDDGPMDPMDASEAGEPLDGTEDVDALDLGAVKLNIVIHNTGDGTNAGAVHQFKKNPPLSARTVNNDCHKSPTLMRHLSTEWGDPMNEERGLHGKGAEMRCESFPHHSLH